MYSRYLENLHYEERLFICQCLLPGKQQLYFHSAGSWVFRSNQNHSRGQRGDRPHWHHQELRSAGQLGWRIHTHHSGKCAQISTLHWRSYFVFVWHLAMTGWIINKVSSAGSHWRAVGSGCSSLETPVPDLRLWQAGLSVGRQHSSAHLDQNLGGEISQHCPLGSFRGITKHKHSSLTTNLKL